MQKSNLSLPIHSSPAHYIVGIVKRMSILVERPFK
jgi:hypothetical protein